MDIEEAMKYKYTFIYKNVMTFGNLQPIEKSLSVHVYLVLKHHAVDTDVKNFHRRLSNKTASAEKELRIDNVE